MNNSKNLAEMLTGKGYIEFRNGSTY
jgi:hypothetical protein